MDEMQEMLEEVCKTHKLPLAQTWIPLRHSSIVAYGDSQEKSLSSSHLTCTPLFSTMYKSQSNEVSAFNRICCDHNFRKGQGLVGMALLSHKPFFCRDITRLPINEYPLAHHARKCGLTGCFAICLRDCTSNQDYVLEFFLPPDIGDPINIDSEYLQDFLYKLLATIKEQFQGFKIASGKELGEELSVEEVILPMNDETDSCSQTTRSPPEALENEREAGQLTAVTNIENGWNVCGAEQNDVVFLWSERVFDEKVGEELCVEEVNFDNDDEICQITRLPLLPESREIVPPLNKLLPVATVRKNGLNVLDTKQNKVDVTSSFKTCAVKTSNRKHKTTGNSFRLEDIQRHFGMKLEDAAESLGVSRSTLKRVCRGQHGIKRWPFPKRRKVKHSSNLKQSNEFVQCGNEQNPDLRIDSLCTHLTPKQATVAVPHTITNATPIQDVRTVTVKARYGDDIFKFKLPLSSKLADLVEKVNIRLPLKDLPLRIKYEDEDRDWVSIACDEDLEECMRSSRSLGMTTIKILVKSITNQAP